MANPCIENKKNMKNDPIPYIRIHRKKGKNVAALCKTQLEKDLTKLTQEEKDKITKTYDTQKESIAGKEIKGKKLSPLEQKKIDQMMKAEEIIRNHKTKLKF